MSKSAVSSALADALPFQRTTRPAAHTDTSRRIAAVVAATIGLACLVAIRASDFATGNFPTSWLGRLLHGHETSRLLPASLPFGVFPRPDDPFHFLPCTNSTLPPKLDDTDPAASWARLYEPNPAWWRWGDAAPPPPEEESHGHPFVGRGIYLCGYLDVPLDWTNASDTRFVRLAVTKYQVAGPGRPSEISKSSRTIVIEPGGPGGSGTAYAWYAGEAVSQRLSGGLFDVLGWDPRGVNISQPSAACFPYNVDRDRWWQFADRYREVSLADTMGQLHVADALTEATFQACWELFGDLGRFLGTGMVARDLEAIRVALGESQLSGYLVSYGTGIGQTYVNMYPDRAGRIILDGTQYVPVEWQQGGFGWGSLDNVTDAWHDGFLGECLDAGPEHCELAKPLPSVVASLGATPPPPLTIRDLEDRIAALLAAVAVRPIAAYTASSGPSLITYSELVPAIYATLYEPHTWPNMARMLADLERGNASLVADMLDEFLWRYDPKVLPPPPATLPDDDAGGGDDCSGGGGGVGGVPPAEPFVGVDTDEVRQMVLCADSFDAPLSASGLVWWDALWANMTATSWIAGNSRFYNVLPCRHYATYWPAPVGVFRGPLNASLAHPVLLAAVTYDPATPLVNGRRLAAAMGHANARLIAHHGYGHATRADPSACTDALMRTYMVDGVMPEAAETHCYADEKPYRYGRAAEDEAGLPAKKQSSTREEHRAVWRALAQQMALFHPGLVRRRG